MIEIAGRQIGPEHPPYLIAEIGSNHDGDLDRALTLIHLASKAGADAVKFQNFWPDTLVSPQDMPDAYRTLEQLAVPLEWMPELAEHAHAHGLGLLTTPFDLEIADAVEPYVDAYKIASGDITYHELIARVAAKGKPVLIAAGASTDSDVNGAELAFVSAGGDVRRLVWMQCTSNYDGAEDMLRYANLRALTEWQERHDVLVGFSDHTPGTIAACTAAALGACVIEKHFTDDTTRVGPDHSFATGPVEWTLLAGDVQATWETLGHDFKTVEAIEDPVPMRRALRYTQDLRANVCLFPEAIRATRPCPAGALPPYAADAIIGKLLKRPVEAGALVRLEDFA